MTAKDDSKLECHINSLTVVQALRLQEGNKPFSWMKVGAADKKALFGTKKANECVYGDLKEPRIRLALQIHEQTFHMLKPQKYTHPDAHVAYIFSTSIKQNMPFKGDWGTKILEELKRTVANESYQKTGYMGNVVVLTCIAYEALGMREDLKEIREDQHVFQEIAVRRDEAQTRATRAKAKEVAI